MGRSPEMELAAAGSRSLTGRAPGHCCSSQPLDPPLLAQRLSPGADLARPRQDHVVRFSRVAHSEPGVMSADSRLEVFGTACRGVPRVTGFQLHPMDAAVLADPGIARSVEAIVRDAGPRACVRDMDRGSIPVAGSAQVPVA